MLQELRLPERELRQERRQELSPLLPGPALSPLAFRSLEQEFQLAQERPLPLAAVLPRERFRAQASVPPEFQPPEAQAFRPELEPLLQAVVSREPGLPERVPLPPVLRARATNWSRIPAFFDSTPREPPPGPGYLQRGASSRRTR